MNIVIRCQDRFYQYGLRALLCEIFPPNLNQTTLTFNDYDHANAACADILILRLHPGEQYICHAEMRFRAPRLMIGLVDKKHIPARGEIPSCIGNIVFIPLNANVSKISKVIKQHWFSLQQAKTPHAVHHCGHCPHKTFTGQQNQLAAFLYAGMTSKQIAYKMAIGQKTVLAHRNALMTKFRLRTDRELLLFLNAVKEKNRHRNGMCESCNDDDGWLV